MQLEVHDGISAVSNFLKTAHLVHPWQLGAIDRVPIDLRRRIFHDQVVLMLQTMHDVVHQSSFCSKLFCCFVAVCPVRIRIPADDVNVFGKFLIVKVIKNVRIRRISAHEVRRDGDVRRQFAQWGDFIFEKVDRSICDETVPVKVQPEHVRITDR